jgi:hypothetical protein|nr:MAG TPA: Protein of unknown function (DUF433) [Caudoviricetes sp.]
MEQVKIKPSVLKEQIDNGMKMKELAEHYGLPVAQMKNVLKTLGLEIRRFRKPLWVIEEEEPEVTNLEEIENTPEPQAEVEALAQQGVEEVPSNTFVYGGPNRFA